MKYKLDFYTQYKQFYVCDKNSKKETESNNFWSIIAQNDRLALGDGILGIGIECYGPVKGELVILNEVNNNYNSVDFDHIVEGGIIISSGVLQILDCPNFSIELEINIKPGNYRMRVYSSNLSSVVGDEGKDYYKIEIWPDANVNREVLKRFRNRIE